MKIMDKEQLINSMIDIWEEDTCYLSCPDFQHPTYSIIKKLAAKKEYTDLVITTILKRMEKSPTHFFTVLTEIIPVEEHPYIPKEIWGKIKEQTKVWIKWGYEKGYLE